jgi:hypothetical protein
MWEMRHAYGISVGKPDGQRPLGRTRGLRKNIKISFKGGRYEGVGFNDLATDRAQWRALATIIMNLRVP